MQQKWELASPAPSSFFHQVADLSPIIAQILYNRNLRAADEIEAFLHGLQPLTNPFTLPDMNKAVARLRQAIRAGECITVYGDFDADGVTSTALMTTLLRSLGGNVQPYIPHRVDEGYGLNSQALRRIAQKGCKVVVTVDCGIRSVREVVYANRIGLTMIVSDHHSVGPEIPPAAAVVNPKRSSHRYPFIDLAGVGVAYKIAQALLRVEANTPLGKGKPVTAESLLDLVAIGTVADIVPLQGENRLLVQEGLKRLNQPQRPGIQALMAVAGVSAGQVNSTTIGFVLGPRINAAGRLESGMIAYKLLTSQASEEAQALAQQLQSLNQLRQEKTRQAVEKAEAEIAKQDNVYLYIVGDPSFHQGIVGLVASKITKSRYRPSIVLQIGEKESHASGRSIPEWHITHALDHCSQYLLRYGGHAMAAGFTVRNENIPAMKACLQKVAAEQLQGQNLAPAIKIDAEISLYDLDWALYEMLQQLEPFGEANPAPVFLSRYLRLVDARPVGKDGKHLKLYLGDERGKQMNGIAFQQGEHYNDLGRYVDVVYQLEENVWNGQRSLQMNILDIRKSAG